MSYTFSASGLPPGLSLVSNRILGTPSTPGNYTAIVTVSDGVSSVSQTVSIAIAGAAVPIPFWQLILSADCASYSLDSARAQLQAFAEAGNYWRDSVATSPLVVAESGVYWLDSVEAAIADDGSYWLDSVTTSPLFVAETGSYWLDSVDAAIAESGSYSLDSAVSSPMVVAEDGSYWLDSVDAAIAESGSYWLDSAVVVTLQAETTSWISRVQGLGGQPTTTGKAAIDAFFVAIKSQSYYSKIKLLQLFAGTTTIASAMAPLLHPTNTAASLSGFSSSDYTASGSGAGIQGNGTGYIDHSYSPFGSSPGFDSAIGTYSKTTASFDGYDVGYVVSGSARLDIIIRYSNGNFFADSFDQSNGRLSAAAPAGVGFAIASRISASDFRYYYNGSQVAIDTLTVATMPSTVSSFYSFYGGLASGFPPSTRKLAFSFAATGLTSTEVSDFSTAVATLVGSL